MWLEGVVQNKWSVSGMRKQRWETLGKVGNEPVDSDIVVSESAEEAQSLALSENARSNDRDYMEGPVHEGPDWGDEERPAGNSSSNTATLDEEPKSDLEIEAPHEVRPFESFTDLPDDVMEAASDFKVAIIRHKADQWSEISRNDMVALLDALKRLAELAPV